MTEQVRADLLYKVVKELGYEVPDTPIDTDLFCRNWFWVGGKDYTTSVDAALTLPMSGNDQLGFNVGGGTYDVIIEQSPGEIFIVSRRVADGVPIVEQIATSICELWHEYRMASKGEQS